MPKELVPIVLFMMIAFIVWIGVHYKSRNRAKVADTLLALSEQGQTLDKEIIKSINSDAVKGPNDDLRTGLVWMAIGLGILIVWGVTPAKDREAVVAGLASIPLLIGLARIIFWHFIGRKSDSA